jgi:RNA polymerase sigma factor (sigma-70 family)
MAVRQLERVVQHLRQAVMPSQTDGQLLDRFIAQRDEDAFAAIVHRHGPMVLAVCRRLLHHEQDVEDAFQATFLVLVRRASVVPRDMVANWLYGVAYRTALKARTMTAKRWSKEKPMREMAEPEAVSQDVRSELRAVLDQEVSHLPNIYRAPIVCCDLEGKSRQEAAHQLGWSEGTLSGRLFRARAILAKRLTRRGVSLAAGSLAVVLSQEAAAVPPSLALSTIRAVGLFLLSGAVSAKVATLTEGVLNAMWVTKLKVPVIMVTVFALSLGGTGLAHRTGAAHANGKTTSVALVADPVPPQPKKDNGQPPTDRERLEKLLKQLDEQIRKLETEPQPVEQGRLREILKKLEEHFHNGRAVEDLTSEARLLRSMVLRREARVAEFKRRDDVRALAATVRKAMEQVLEPAREANDKRSEIEILEEIEKTVKELKRKAQNQDVKNENLFDASPKK